MIGIKNHYNIFIFRRGRKMYFNFFFLWRNWKYSTVYLQCLQKKKKWFSYCEEKENGVEYSLGNVYTKRRPAGRWRVHVLTCKILIRGGAVGPRMTRLVSVKMERGKLIIQVSYYLSAAACAHSSVSSSSSS